LFGNEQKEHEARWKAGDFTLAEIDDAIRLMEQRLKSGQGEIPSAICRLSLPMTRCLRRMLDEAMKQRGKTESLGEPFFGVDGCPNDETLEKIEEWRGDVEKLLRFVKDAWDDVHGYGVELKIDDDRIVFEGATGGWSGNGSLLYHLKLSPSLLAVEPKIEMKGAGAFRIEVSKKNVGRQERS